MNYYFDVTVKATLDLTADERALLRQSLKADGAEAPFRRFPSTWTQKDVEAVRDNLKTAIDAGIYDGETKIAATKLAGELDNIVVDFQLGYF